MSLTEATAANLSASAASSAAWRFAAEMTPPPNNGKSRVAQASDAMVVGYPRSNAARTVEETHICVMKPATSIDWPGAPSWDASSVSANALGFVFSMIRSPSFSFKSSMISPR